MEPSRALGILRQVARALAVAHRSGVSRAGLSLDAIVIGIRDGRRDAVEVRRGALRRDSKWVPISPERVLGLPHGPAEDAYLFGCVAFAVLAGRPVFEDDDVDALRRRHAIEDAPDLEDMPGGQDVPPPIRRFVARCLSKEPDERFAHGTELEAAFCEAQIEAGIVSPWDHLPPPDVEPRRRRRIVEGLQRLWDNETREEAAASGRFLKPGRGRYVPEPEPEPDPDDDVDVDFDVDPDPEPDSLVSFRPPPRRWAVASSPAEPVHRTSRHPGPAEAVPAEVDEPDHTPIVETELISLHGVPDPVFDRGDETPVVATVPVAMPPAPGERPPAERLRLPAITPPPAFRIAVPRRRRRGRVALLVVALLGAGGWAAMQDETIARRVAPALDHVRNLLAAP